VKRGANLIKIKRDQRTQKDQCRLRYVTSPGIETERPSCRRLDSERIDAMLEKAERGVIDGTYIAVTPQFLVTATR
jgi:hypothetical protein